MTKQEQTLVIRGEGGRLQHTPRLLEKKGILNMQWNGWTWRTYAQGNEPSQGNHTWSHSHGASERVTFMGSGTGTVGVRAGEVEVGRDVSQRGRSRTVHGARSRQHWRGEPGTRLRLAAPTSDQMLSGAWHGNCVDSVRRSMGFLTGGYLWRSVFSFPRTVCIILALLGILSLWGAGFSLFCPRRC